MNKAIAHAAELIAAADALVIAAGAGMGVDSGLPDAPIFAQHHDETIARHGPQSPRKVTLLPPRELRQRLDGRRL